MTDKNDKTPEQKLPSLFSMIKSFGKDLTKYIKEGAPNVSIEDYAQRLDVCMQCPSYIKSSARCGECGCLLEHKAKWKTSTCPINKWAPQETEEDTGKDDFLNGQG